MIPIVKLYYFIFGALTILGGLMGFLKKHSVASLIAGGLCGILLIIAGVLLKDKVPPALILGGVVSLALLGKFLPAFLHKHTWMPGGIMCILALIGIIVSVLGFAKN